MSNHFSHTRTATWDHHAVNTAYQRFNKKVAIKITGVVGFDDLRMDVLPYRVDQSLPAIFTEAFHLTFFPHWLVRCGLIALVAWLAQTFHSTSVAVCDYGGSECAAGSIRCACPRKLLKTRKPLWTGWILDTRRGNHSSSMLSWIRYYLHLGGGKV